MLKSLKQLKVTFTSISLLILLCVSLILFVAQMALAQTDARPDAVRPVPFEVRSAQQAERKATVDAQTAVSSTTSADLRTNTDARRGAIEWKRALIAERRAAGSAVLAEQTQAHVTALAERAANRLESAIDKLSGLSERIRTHAGTRADAATLALLDQADAILADAERALADISVDIELVVTSDQPRTDWVDVRAQFAAVHDLITQAHELLRQAITSLKNQR